MVIVNIPDELERLLTRIKLDISKGERILTYFGCPTGFSWNDPGKHYEIFTSMVFRDAAVKMISETGFAKEFYFAGPCDLDDDWLLVIYVKDVKTRKEEHE